MSCCGTSSRRCACSWRPWCSTGYLFVSIPKGFFPQQDTGLITGTSEAAQDVSFAEMMRRQEALGEIIGKDPAVATYAMALGAGGSSADHQQRPLLHHAEAARASATSRPFEVIARLRPQLEKVEGARLFLQAAQDVNVGGRAVAHAVPVHAAGRQPRRAERVGAQGAGEAEIAADAARRGLRPADLGQRR